MRGEIRRGIGHRHIDLFTFGVEAERRPHRTTAERNVFGIGPCVGTLTCSRNGTEPPHGLSVLEPKGAYPSRDDHLAHGRADENEVVVDHGSHRDQLALLGLGNLSSPEETPVGGIQSEEVAVCRRSNDASILDGHAAIVEETLPFIAPEEFTGCRVEGGCDPQWSRTSHRHRRWVPSGSCFGLQLGTYRPAEDRRHFPC